MEKTEEDGMRVRAMMTRRVLTRLEEREGRDSARGREEWTEERAARLAGQTANLFRKIKA